MKSGVRRVLRVGAIRAGRIVLDRLVELDEDVVLGRDPGLECSPGEGAWTLLRPSGDRHVLRIPDAMRGRIRRGDEVLDLSRIKDDPFSARTGQGWSLQLQGREQGRLELGEHVLLFAYQEVGRVPVRPFRPHDFRPPLLEDGDRGFVASLGVVAALAAVLVAWVATTEPVAQVEAPTLPPAVHTMVFEMPEPEPMEVEVVEEHGPGEAVEVALEAPKPLPGGEAAPTPEPDAQATPEALVQESPLLVAIMTTGKGTPMGDLFAPDDFGSGDLDALMRSGRRVATKAAPGLREHGGHGDVDIDDLGELGTGGVSSVDMTTLHFVIIIDDEVEGVDLEQVTQQDLVAEVVRSKNAALRYCYEMRLKEVPGLRGRVEVEWTIRSGRVVDVQLLADTTGDPQLVDCVLGNIATWRFPPSVRGEVSWPFVFRPSK